MKNMLRKLQRSKSPVLTLALSLIFSAPTLTYASATPPVQQQATQQHTSVKHIQQINPTTLELIYEDNTRMTLDFYGDHIIRLFQDNSGGIIRNPKAVPPAQILVDNPRKQVSKLEFSSTDQEIVITTSKIQLTINKQTSLMKAINLENNQVAFEQVTPVEFSNKRVSLQLKENPKEYFYGGGVQNGRFSHKGKVIAIENQNSWTDGGVASPTPFYWSTKGYGILWHTFQKGQYDFGAKNAGIVNLHHDTSYLDLFLFINDGAVPLLNDFYQLTGNPVLIPKFGFYQGHLNAYNRDYWKEDDKGILFEDGKRYKESQKDNGGTKESLNGEKNNYQFSARAVIDRYEKHNMPFGWLLPNDGYGAGYGQEETLDGNIHNLKKLTDYAHQKGVEIGLWTQSDLHPKEGVSPLLQRDIVKEVRDAGVRVLKTDVAWVGAGYSFGLNGIADVAKIMPYYGDNSRPFIITLDGWAGTQRYAGIWSGDQTGGVWEYIRFHIPTYLGSGLSGQPNICSDMDGIFGGKNPIVNTRDFQWKTFTPMQLNMDGWGANEKYPHALGEPTTSINRMYLKWKSELLPYAYSIAYEAIDGQPMIRALFLDYPNAYTLGKNTEYQFLYGPYFLIAPIYQDTNSDDQGNDSRNNIYLPQGTWIDYLSGDLYTGDCILNNFDAPIWKLPVFVKGGAIIPLTNPNNNLTEINQALRIFEVYPQGYSSFVLYDDDGRTELYRQGEGVTTRIESEVDDKNKATITIHPTQGNFNGFMPNKQTEIRINTTQKPSKLTAQVGGKKIKLTEVSSQEEFEQKDNVFFYNEKPNLNQFATPGSPFESIQLIKNPQLLVKLESTNTSNNAVVLTVKDYIFSPENKLLAQTGDLTPPKAQVTEDSTQAYQVTASWEPIAQADFYEIELNEMLYTTIQETKLRFENLEAETTYNFKIRAVNKSGYSDWATFTATTLANPLEFAIPGIEATSTATHQGGYHLSKLVDFDEGNLWHTKWKSNAVPFDILLNLKTINQLDKIDYLPRIGRGNGTLLQGKIYYSHDKKKWIEAGNFKWANNDDVKTFVFDNQPTAQFVKIEVTEAVGGFGSGRELYVFKVPQTESYIPGDINNDGKIDYNDFTSYTNYTGLRKGDGDFDGYISKGDLNKNDLIDAYDISVAATQLDGGVSQQEQNLLAGNLTLTPSTSNYAAGETFEILVKGVNLKQVNALSFALPYDPSELEYQGVDAIHTLDMENLTYDRLHSNGDKVLYPTFVNLGEKKLLEGSEHLFTLKFKAKRKGTFKLKATDTFIVDRALNTLTY